VGIRYIVLMIFAFVFELFFLSKELKFKDNPLSVEKIDIEFKNSKTYDMDSTRINSILICDKIQQKGEKKTFIKPVATLFDENITKSIISKKALLDDKSDIITLKEDINIIYNDKKLSTQMLKYDISNSTVIDSSAFKIVAGDILAKGEHLFFDTKKSILKAKNIDYKLYMKE